MYSQPAAHPTAETEANTHVQIQEVEPLANATRRALLVAQSGTSGTSTNLHEPEPRIFPTQQQVGRLAPPSSSSASASDVTYTDPKNLEAGSYAQRNDSGASWDSSAVQTQVTRAESESELYSIAIPLASLCIVGLTYIIHAVFEIAAMDNVLPKTRFTCAIIDSIASCFSLKEVGGTSFENKEGRIFSRIRWLVWSPGGCLAGLLSVVSAGMELKYHHTVYHTGVIAMGALMVKGATATIAHVKSEDRSWKQTTVTMLKTIEKVAELLGLCCDLHWEDQRKGTPAYRIKVASAAVQALLPFCISLVVLLMKSNEEPVAAEK
ncbi:Hypothetical protein D9617_111g064730 [Elsinoe fawcettii]|nr:Hypothetical protein D9617_111g064730 [Elsinoe fawcettii]